MEGKGKFWITDINGEIPPAMDTKGKNALPPRTVMEVFKAAVAKKGDSTAVAVKRDGAWVKWTYKHYYEDTMKVAASFVKLGLQPGNGVSILGFNSPEWFISDLGAIAAGGVACGIYTSNGSEACHYVVDHSDSVVVVTENEQQTSKILAVKDRLPKLKKIVQWSGKLPENNLVISWETLLTLGQESDKAEVERRIADLKPGKTCTLIYTSGTTGPPKGVMVSHDSLTWTPSTALDKVYPHPESGPFVIVSYLPLSHIAAQMLDIHVPLSCAGEVWFAAPDALKGSLVNTLKEVRPTHFLGVPRVWERIEEKMRATGAQVSGVKKTIATWAKAKGLEGNYKIENGQSTPWGWWLANHIVFSKVHQALGLDRCVHCASGAAPISKSTLEYFMSLNLPIYELYGMSETTGIVTVSYNGKVKTGTCGTVVEGVDIKIDSPDQEGNGEICFKGRNLFLGYLKNDKETGNSFDKDGYLHSGDIGRIDKAGFLQITGRIKELIITAGGENIPPVLIEDDLKKFMPAVSNAMVVGDKRKFLSCLFTLKLSLNENAKESEYQLSSNLAPLAISEFEKVGSSAKTIQEAVKDEKVRNYIQAGIDKYNKTATSNAQSIQKFEILEKDFSLEDGEFTPTLKLKRRVVVQMYTNVIDNIYGESERK